LEADILPDLVERFPAPLRIWSAGCASGEEPYSVAMVWCELAFPTALDLLATDADSACLRRARAGSYPSGSLKEVPAAMRDKYFEPARGGRRLMIRGHRLPAIRWRRHDLLDPPSDGGPFHLILLRNNLFTYYRDEDLDTALRRILAVLATGGYLVTGTHERLPNGDFLLSRNRKCPWIYRLEASGQDSRLGTDAGFYADDEGGE
jgi:chemotaxis protein methyltransferase CheR